ncbi:MAG: glycosyltransferase [Acholeplasmataceae bacterium]
MKILLFPFSNNKNEYINYTKQIYNEIDVDLLELTYKNLTSSYLYVQMNWFESLPNNIIRANLIFLKRLFLIYVLKKHKKKIVYVYHNIKPHNNRNKMQSSILQYLLIKYSSHIIYHCEESLIYLKKYFKDESNYHKFYFIPLHNYVDGEYKSYIINRKKMKFLYFGLISKYKNIELLINAFKSLKYENIELELIGQVNTNNYKKRLIHMCETDKRISYRFQFIEGELLDSIIKQSDVTVFPFDKRSMLNSSSIIYSASKGKTFISPTIGTTKEFMITNSFYCYDYKNKDEHFTELVRQMKIAYDDFCKNKMELKSMLVYNQVVKNNSKELIKERYIKLLKLEGVKNEIV